MDRAALTLLSCALSCAVSCGGKTRELPPLGEALLVVDTDLPLAIAQRLRIDVYEGGAWIESRDVLLPSRASFPVSFSVFTPSGEREAIVRLRIHAEGRTREYQGERFAPRAPGVTADAAGNGLPRLVKDGADVTPKEEPIPLVTVDRLVRVHVVPGVRGRASVVLRGECIGTMADLAGARTCVDHAGELVSVAAESLAPDMTLPSDTLVGTFATKTACPGAPRDGEVCVEGGFTFLGVPYAQGLFRERGVEIPALISPFFIDRNEVTVARFRAAVAAGLKITASDPYPNDNDIERTADNPEYEGLCTWSQTRTDRENFPLNCITPERAQAFCRFVSGDLPTELQWTYAAVIAGRPERTPYPWGGTVPDCDRAVFGRTEKGECEKYPGGPQPVSAGAGDDSLGLGLHGMHGNVKEWTRDAFVPLYDSCWYAAPLRDPSCEIPSLKVRVVGGVSFFDPTLTQELRQSARTRAQEATVGFRCVRSAL